MRPVSLLSILPLIFHLSGCSVLPQRPPAPALHDFGPGVAQESSSHAAGSAISVSAPQWLMDETIHYRLAFDDPTRVRSYNLDRWIAPPPALLAQRLVTTATDEQHLAIRLLTFEQVFESPRVARVVMHFRAKVKSKDTNAVLSERLFQFSAPCPTADAKGAVIAFARLVGDADRQLRQWLADQPSPNTLRQP